MVDTVKCDASVRCTVTENVTLDCPIVEEPDRYRVHIVWEPGPETLEKWALVETIQSYEGREMTQEKFCADLANQMREAELKSYTVKVQDVAHMDMVVTNK